MYNGPGGRDWTAYVDIDLSEQKVRYYNEKDEELFVTDCVTGDVSKGRSTPTGLYYLRAKKSPEVLTGFNADGTKDYETHVTYWMPFIRNSIGLHLSLIHISILALLVRISSCTSSVLSVLMAHSIRRWSSVALRSRA